MWEWNAPSDRGLSLEQNAHEHSKTAYNSVVIPLAKNRQLFQMEHTPALIPRAILISSTSTLFALRRWTTPLETSICKQSIFAPVNICGSSVRSRKRKPIFARRCPSESQARSKLCQKYGKSSHFKHSANLCIDAPEPIDLSAFCMNWRTGYVTLNSFECFIFYFVRRS